MTTYLHREDVADYILEMAATEVSDVRDRLEEAARNLLEVGKKDSLERNRKRKHA
jgi:hypothetical protein